MNYRIVNKMIKEICTSNKSCFNRQVKLIVPIGSYNDDNLKGISHLIEHLLILSLQTKYDIFNYEIKGTTYFEYTEYSVCCSNNNMGIAFNMLKDLFCGKYLDSCYFEKAKNDVLDEYESYFKKINKDECIRILLSNDTLESLPIGNKTVINSLTYNDAIDFFKNTYKSSCAYIFSNDWLIEVSDDYRILISEPSKKCNSILHLIQPCSKYRIQIKNNQNGGYNIFCKYIPTERYLEELSFYIIEMFIEHYFKKVLGSSANVMIFKKIYTIKEYFLLISVRDINKTIMINKERVDGFFSFFDNNFDCYAFNKATKKYSRAIKRLHVNSTDYTNEIQNQIVYGTEMFEKEIFINNIKNTSFFRMRDYLNSLKNINYI